MKIIDFEKKGNVVRFYLGTDDNEDYKGDDWNDVPYECNAEKVYKEHIVGYRDMAFPFELSVLEPKDSEYQNYSRWCKNDMKARRVPCIIAVPKPDDWHDDEFNRYVGDERTIKFYFGDKMEPSDTITVFKAEKKYEKTKFIAKKYFDYHLERKVVFDDKDECEKFIDEQNKKIEHLPRTWWEGYTETVEASDEKTCVQGGGVE